MTYIEAFPDSWLLGVPTVDEEHQRLFNALKNMVNNGQKPPGCDVQFLDWFLMALKKHFETEESAMFEHEYPNAEEHRRHHSVVFERLSKFRDTGLDEIEIAKECHKAFVRDVVIEDLKFKKFYDEKEKK